MNLSATKKYVKVTMGLLLSISLFSFLMTACTLGRRYTKPDFLDDNWTWKNQVIQDTISPYAKSDIVENTILRKDSMTLSNDWWTAFNDDTLDDLVQTAFNSNPTLKAAAFRIMESRGMVTTAKSNLFPIITVDPNANRTLLSGNRPSVVSSNSLPALTYNTISAPLDMSYEVDVWGKFRKGIESAQATMLASEADYQVIKLNLAADISSNYFNLRLLDNQIQLLNSSLILRKINLQMTASQYEAGITTKLDVLQAEIEAATLEGQIIEARRSRATLENALSVLCGIPVTNFTIKSRQGLPKVPSVPLEIPSDLLQRRPDVVESRELLVAGYAQIGIAEAAFFPSLKITAASFGFLSSKVENLFSNHSLTWIGGLGMSIPIFTGGRNIAQLRIAEAKVKELQANYQQTVLTAMREVQDAMTNIQYRAEQDAVQKRLLISSHSSADMSKELYKKGLTTYINVIVADRAVLDAENTYLTIVSQRLLYSISLIKALGGGWKGK